MQDDSTAANTATIDGAGAPASTSLNNANLNKEDQLDESKLLLHDH